MRGSLLLSLGLSASVIASVALTVPSQAGPAYTKDQLLQIFKKDKELMKKDRGIHFASDDDVANAAAPAPVAGGPTHVDLLVNFDIDSANLTSEAKVNLSEFAAAAKDPSLKGTKFKIDGYTDATGPEAYNLTLSERRAQSVVAFLASLGVDANTLRAKGYGKNNPRETDPYSPKNRRVEGYVTE